MINNRKSWTHCRPQQMGSLSDLHPLNASFWPLFTLHLLISQLFLEGWTQIQMPRIQHWAYLLRSPCSCGVHSSEGTNEHNSFRRWDTQSWKRGQGISCDLAGETTPLPERLGGQKILVQVWESTSCFLLRFYPLFLTLQASTLALKSFIFLCLNSFLRQQAFSSVEEHQARPSWYGSLEWALAHILKGPEFDSS